MWWVGRVMRAAQAARAESASSDADECRMAWTKQAKLDQRWAGRVVRAQWVRQLSTLEG